MCLFYAMFEVKVAGNLRSIEKLVKLKRNQKPKQFIKRQQKLKKTTKLILIGEKKMSIFICLREILFFLIIFSYQIYQIIN